MFAIWLLPNEKDTKYLEKIINKLSLEFDSPKFIPHITIHGLIDLDFNEIEEIIKKFIHQIRPFVISKREIKQSDDIWKSLYIDIKKNKELCFINSKLNQEFQQSDNDEFLPHISLMYKKLNKIQKLKIIESLKIKKEFEINRISILKFSNNVNEWEIVRIFDLIY